VEARIRISTRASAGLLALALLLAAALVLPAGQARATTGPPTLFVSPKADRSGARPLDGTTVPAPVYVFVARSTSASDAAGIDRVDFKIDGIGVRVEELAPFDLAATATSFAAGSHRVDAKVRLTSGATSTVTATFTAGAPATTTTTSTSTTSTSTTSTTAKPVVTTTTSTTAPPAPTVVSRLPRFAAGSFWYRPLPSTVPLHPASATLVADFDRQWKQYYANVGINTTSYTPPVFVASATTALRVVRVWDCQGKGFLDPALTTQLLAVPIPDAAAPSSGSDAELVISQPSTDSLWELWRARRTSTGGWEACWGGKLSGASTGSGLFPWPFGTTATGISLAGGLISPEELTAGRIDHALAISLVDLKAKVFSWPASRTDGSSTATNAIAEGQRFRLDPTIDVDVLPITRTAKIVAKALQTYGMVVRDKSGSVTFYAENTLAEGRTDLYPALFGTPTYKVLAGIPWTRLQALPTDFGKS
jgi:hypothetical protein